MIDPLVLEYHATTKHHPHRYARSLGYLDWETQPDPFRRFEGAPLVRLPIPTDDDTPPYDDLYKLGAVKSAPLSMPSISRLFECSLAISAWKQAGEARWALRVNPSSGNLHPTEGYLVVGAVCGIGELPALYHYAPKEHGLERRTEFASETWDRLMKLFPNESFLVGLTSILWREAWKYGERAFRYCQHDVGHALGALRLAAATLGWQLVMLAGLRDTEIGQLLGVDRDADFANAEREHPDLVAVVLTEPVDGPLPTSLDTSAIAPIARGDWAGKANVLSNDHAEWPIIDRVAQATEKTADGVASAMSRSAGREIDRAPAAVLRPCDMTARQVIRQRRSALGFDGSTSISGSTFFHILSRVLPRPGGSGVPWDCWPWSPHVDLLMFVHRVEGLPRGLYCLVRDTSRLERLRDATKTEFTWSKPNPLSADPDSLPLYALAEVDCRRAASQLSLGQDIAGDGVFSLGMVADFERGLRKHGAWFYRRFFWEAGLVGQVLYLEAEAAGIRATGIGAYFDDAVHEVFGLGGREFQSMYHFTMGGPVDDVRLSTLSAYPDS